MHKKGVEIAFNTIIMAVIAIIVLVVIIYLIFNGVENTRQGTACADVQGRCVAAASCDTHVIEGKRDNGKDLCAMGECCSIV